ncbi:hypothetical protein K474DRAFT_1606613 [Panus rudis PR-1116 ss-1]|nr:hypothetical protein K474DRAFT_1606613 [Panus rudis PR-1116 ss-1]
MQVALFDAAKLCEPWLARKYNKYIHHSSPPWRADPQYFQTRLPDLAPGVIDVSPGWYMTGHEVASPMLRHWRGTEWSTLMREPAALVSGLLRIMHPDQYRMARDMMMRLARFQHLEDPLRRWPAIVTAIAMIANRESPLHRDSGAQHPWFDILVSVGDYSTAEFHMDSLGCIIPNPPGTAIALSGAAIRHGSAHADGSRVCYSFYMREDVRRSLGVPAAGWIRQQVYEACLGSHPGNVRIIL